jgi:hypothetical protein
LICSHRSLDTKRAAALPAGARSLYGERAAALHTCQAFIFVQLLAGKPAIDANLVSIDDVSYILQNTSIGQVLLAITRGGDG